MKHVKGLINFIQKGYTPYHVTENFKQMLLESGYEYISSDVKNAQLGKKYFTIFNDSALVAFTTPTTTENVEAHIVASHNDSPTFKLKPNFLMADNNYLSKLIVNGKVLFRIPKIGYFYNFLSNPINAAQNMDYLGYTPFIGGKEII